MKKTFQLLAACFLLLSFTSCDFLRNTLTFKDKTKTLVDAILKEDYDKAIQCFALDHASAKNMDVEKLKEGLRNFRASIVSDFGTSIDYTLMKSEKTWSTEENKNTPPNTTVALIQISNGKQFGVLRLLFDDLSGKILNVNQLTVKEPVPDMTIFWLFGVITLCVPIFNILVIRKINRSDRKGKWAKYIAVILLNAPSVTFHAVNGMSFSLLNFQILMGFSFTFMGYANSAWTFGIPLGGLYWWWRLREKKYVTTGPLPLPDDGIDHIASDIHPAHDGTSTYAHDDAG